MINHLASFASRASAEADDHVRATAADDDDDGLAFFRGLLVSVALVTPFWGSVVWLVAGA